MPLLDRLFVQFDADFDKFDASVNQAENRSRQIKQKIEKNLKFQADANSLTQQLQRVNDQKFTNRVQERVSSIKPSQRL